MNLKIKICGIKTKSAALASAKYGADFLGFNFVPSSKRRITPSVAQKIIKILQSRDPSADAKAIADKSAALRMTPLVVGVFKDQSESEIKKVLSYVKLDMLQFHGQERPQFCQSFGLPYIKAFGVSKNTSTVELAKQMSKYKAKYFLLDRPKQGKGQIIDLKKVKQLAAKFPVVLAGGLTPKNVRAAILRAGKIKGVDVAGGVETKGKKDLNKIESFIHFAKIVAPLSRKVYN